MAVLVSHPHLAAVAAGVARVLASQGKLAGLYTGVAFVDRGWRGAIAGALARARPVLRNRIVDGVPPERLHALFPVELGARASGALLARTGLKTYDAIFGAHDRAVSLLPWPRQTTAVYAYEDGARATFARARRRDIETIWDLPTPYYEMVARVFGREAQRWPDAAIGPPHCEPTWKRRRKDAELALATKISVASSFTKRSLEDAGVTAPIVVAPYGFPAVEFAPKSAPPTGPFTVVSVGSHDLRKGTPYLLEAWKRAAIADARLHIIGPIRLAKAFVDRFAGSFQHSQHLPRSALAPHYAAADLCVFPTLCDGFGLVIQEAMSCGTPVVTTPCGGGPECISDGVDGWIVPPGDIDALVERLRAAAASRDRLFAMGRAARARAERWTWREAGAALVAGLGL